MRREELRTILKALNPTDEMIDSIMAINGADINKLNSDITDLKNQLKSRDTDIANLKNSVGDNEQLTTQLTELQGKYDADTKALQSQIDKRNYTDAVRAAISENNIKFTSKSAENYYISQAETKQMKLDNGKLVGFNDFHKAQLEADKSAFVITEENPDKSYKPAMQFAGPMGTDKQGSLSPAAAAAARFNKQFTNSAVSAVQNNT